MTRTPFLLLLLAPVLAFATLNVNPNSTSVTPGVWCGNYPAAKSYAETNAIPLVLVWGNEGCPHCANLTNALSQSDALSWAAGQNAVFCFVEGKSGNDVAPNVGAKAFAKTAGGLSPNVPTSYPFVCFYMVGQSAMTYGGIETFSLFKSNYDAFIFNLREADAYFPFGTTENDRLEAIIGETQQVHVPVSRRGDLSAATTVFGFSCGSVSWTQNIQWAEGDTLKYVPCAIPSAFSAARSATLTLSTPGGKVLDERAITGIDEAENSTKNPKWIGEPIDYGEWSMDLDAVTNLVATSGGHALILFAGGCWCPDCAMTDARLFDRDEFKQWAKANHVALGVIDIPNDPSNVMNFPSLLMYTSYRTSDNYVTLRKSAPADETMRYQSGAGYLSRHSISPEAALAVIERNRFLAMNTVLAGGWNSADRADKTRPGVPSLIVLRPDGTICGRWTPFNEVGPSAYSEGFLRRFEELFAQAGETAEESNDFWTTTPSSISTNQTITATVSAGDAKDVYRIDATLYTVMTFMFEADKATPFTLKVTDCSGDAPVTLAENTGIDDGRCSVTARVSSAQCYLEVSFPTTKGIANHPVLAATNLSSTVAAYSLSATGEMSAGDFCFEETAKAVSEGAGPVAIRVVRKNGDGGAASVTVERVDKAQDDRIEWENTTLSWAAGESGVKTAYLTVKDDSRGTYDLSLRFALAGSVPIPSATSQMTVTVHDDDLSGIPAYRNVAVAESYAIEGWQPGDAVLVKKVSGSLPAGLAVAVSGGTMDVSGIPAKNGTWTATYRICVRRGGQEVSTYEIELSYIVRDIDYSGVVPDPSAAKTYRNVPVVVDGRLAATLTLTVPPSGRASAKCRWADGATTRYASKSWSAYSAAESSLTAILEAMDGTGEIQCEFASSNVTFAVFGATGAKMAEAGPFAAEPWGADSPADAWEGQYNVQLPQTNTVEGSNSERLSGAAYMALRMAGESAKRSGTMLYAGVLPNGRAVSGYATLWKSGGDPSATMAFCASSGDAAAPYSFSGAFSVTPRTAAPGWRWIVDAVAAVEWSVPDAYGHAGAFAVYGGYYDADEIAAAFALDFESDADTFAFAADTGALAAGRYGTSAAMEPVAAKIEDGAPVIDGGDPNPQGVTLSFSRTSGVVSGTLLLPFSGGGTAAIYRGIALPGWQGCGECSELPERPWALGSCSLSDRCANGVFRNGCAVGLGRFKAQSAQQE